MIADPEEYRRTEERHRLRDLQGLSHYRPVPRRRVQLWEVVVVWTLAGAGFALLVLAMAGGKGFLP